MSRNFVADTVRVNRLAQGMTLHTLAKKARVAKGTLSQIENGKNMPTFDTLEKVLGALGLRAEFVSSDDASVRVGLHPAASKLLSEVADEGLNGLGREGVAQRFVEDGLRRYCERLAADSAAPSTARLGGQ